MCLALVGKTGLSREWIRTICRPTGAGRSHALQAAASKTTRTALARAARSHGKRMQDFSDEQKAVCFAAAALAIEDLSSSLAYRLLGPLRLALGDVHTYPVPSWADSL